jgi:hypothetical protein
MRKTIFCWVYCYSFLNGRTPEKLVEVIHKKLINSGKTVPFEAIRKALFSTATIPRVEPKTPGVTVVSTSGAPVPWATIVAIADNGTTKSEQTDSNGMTTLTIPTRRRYELAYRASQFRGRHNPFMGPSRGCSSFSGTY